MPDYSMVGNVARCAVCGSLGARYCPECDASLCESCHEKSPASRTNPVHYDEYMRRLGR